MQSAPIAHRAPIVPTPISMSLKLAIIVLIMSTATTISSGQFLPVRDVEAQPLAAATERLIDAMEFTGWQIAISLKFVPPSSRTIRI